MNLGKRIGILAALATMGSTAFAVGYEKSVMFGGKSAGMAGIATPYTQGAEAVYFNPAGMVSDRVGQQATFYISPSANNSEGPFNNNNDKVSSDSQVSTPFGLFYNYTMNESWGFGGGVYVAGGSKIKFSDLDIGIGTTKPMTVASDLQLIEVALGTGYRVNDKLKVGIAYRMSFAQANFAFVQRATATQTLNAEGNDIKGNNFMGFKLGAQYKLSEDTTIGFAYRSDVGIKGKGKYGGNYNLNNGGQFAIHDDEAEVSTVFPQGANLGMMHKLSDMWNLYAEYAWVNYAKGHHVTIDGTITADTIGVLAADPGDLQQDWNDEHNIRLAAEYLGWSMPLRFGYQWVSAVTAPDFPRITSSAPVPGHGLSIGTEKGFGENLLFTAAADYSYLSGHGNGADAGTSGAGTDIRSGTYTTTSWGVHLGVDYKF